MASKSMPFHNELFLRFVTSLIVMPLVIAIVCLGSPYLNWLGYMLIGGMSVEWVNINRKTVLQSLKGFAIFLSGEVYIITAVVLLLGWHNQPLLILWLLSVVWATDIGAYFVGSHMGGPKLAPCISPRKTWSGFVGGIVCGVAVGHLVNSYTVIHPPLFLPVTLLIVSMAVQGGDLIESAVKRYFDVKDSGTIIPGHGGLLDRLDGLLLAIISYKLLLILVKL